MNINEEKDIPLELKNIALCSRSFYRVKSPLELEESWSALDKIVKCTILITETNSMIEVENGNVKHVKDLNIKNSKKIIIHQEFHPFHRYVVLLTAEMVAYLLDYKDMEKIKSWDNVSDILSEDLLSEGKPTLILKLNSGKCLSISKEEFLTDGSSEARENSRVEAHTALNNKLKSVVWLAESLEAERIRKEAFIAHKISNLSLQLQGVNNEPVGLAKPIQTSPSQTSTSSSKTSVLKVLSTRQRIVHNKWVIGVIILNDSDKFLIRNPDILLHSEKSLKSLHYTTRRLRTYQRTKIKSSCCSLKDSDVIIEDLEPPILKPKRKALLFAICSFPDFSYGEILSCGGIISYQIRNLRPDTEIDDNFKQIPFPSVQLSAKNLNLSCADIIKDQGGAGLSFSVISMIVASTCHTLTIKSFGSPLDQVLEAFSKEPKLVTAEGLSYFFCFYTPDCPPLHLASFVCKPLTANVLTLKSYTKDDNQALILIHNICKYLPIDAFISSEESGKTSSGESFYEKLLPLLKSVTSKIDDAFIGESDKRRNIEKGNSKQKYEMEENKYCKWRNELSKLSASMEMLNRNDNVQ